MEVHININIVTIQNVLRNKNTRIENKVVLATIPLHICPYLLKTSINKGEKSYMLIGNRNGFNMKGKKTVKK
jgi:hypothetical protein